MSNRLTLEGFIEKAKQAHGNKYDYSKVDYINNKTKVCIICPEHGEFWQRPDEHLKGRGCPYCVPTKHYTTQEFIQKANKVHNNFFRYNKTKYVNARTKVIVTCPMHGDFEIKPNNHLQGQGCAKCYREKIEHEITLQLQKGKSTKRLDSHKITKYINQTYGNLYSTEFVEYTNNKTPIKLYCHETDFNGKEHGLFTISPSHLLDGEGCPKCGKNKTLTNEEFKAKANFVHGNKYGYNNTEYRTTHGLVSITCPIHGEFMQSPANHLRGQGCPKCGILYSNAEMEIYKYIVSLIGEENVILHDKTLLNGKELDIYIPDYHLAIEYNGSLWHSTKYKEDKNYHLNKYLLCKEQGIQLLQIFDDEYKNSKKIIQSKIKILLKLNTSPVIGARKTEIKEISKKDCVLFLNNNHIQGFTTASIYLGAYYQEQLVGVMLFKKEDSNTWILNRCATNIDYRCPGVVSKLFKYFLTHYKYNTIKSFLDLRYGNRDKNIYLNLGFIEDEILKPDYTYYDNTKNRRIHKFNCRKQKLSRKYGLSLKLTESQMTTKIGLYKVFDVGKIKYIFKLNKGKNS